MAKPKGKKGKLRSFANVRGGKRAEVEADDKILPKGAYCQAIWEPIPAYHRGGCETILQGDNNAFIVLGRDRPGNAATGLGGAGATNCGMIDLIVGLDNCDVQFPPEMEANPEAITEAVFKELSELTPYAASPSTHADAARMYLTQRGNVDYYFGLANGSLVPGGAKNKSGAVIKADHVRLVARNHIKIITGKQKLIGTGFKGEKNSTCGYNSYPGQIDFIAGNTDDPEPSILMSALGKLFGLTPPPKTLQPLVKGENLVELFDELFKIISDLAERITENTNNIKRMCWVFNKHVHITAIGGPSTPPDFGAWLDAMGITISGWKTSAYATVVKQNMTIVQTNYLKLKSPVYINSRYVNTT